MYTISVRSCANKGHAFTFVAGALFCGYRNRFHGRIAKKKARAHAIPRAYRRWRNGRARGRGGPLSPAEAERATNPRDLLR